VQLTLQVSSYMSRCVYITTSSIVLMADRCICQLQMFMARTSVSIWKHYCCVCTHLLSCEQQWSELDICASSPDVSIVGLAVLGATSPHC
jgi:hypothetical protein